MTKKRIDCTEETRLSQLLVGRKVVEVDKTRKTMTLDSGIKIRVIPNYGCSHCGSGAYFFVNVANFNHVITSAKVVESFDSRKETANEMRRRYHIFVYAEGVATRTKLMTVQGNDGNGYYGTGFTLEIEEV